MKLISKIKGFTLAEFSVSMTIGTIIIGLLLFSFYFLNKWNYNYYHGLGVNEEIFEFVTTLRQDIFLSKKVSFDKDRLTIIKEKLEVDYEFKEDMIIRKDNLLSDSLFFDQFQILVKGNQTHSTTVLELKLLIIDNTSDTTKLIIPFYQNTLDLLIQAHAQ